MSHGVDVNKNRLDDLDRIILRDSLLEPFNKKNICNIGCGESSLSVALCALGHFVYNYDTRDLNSFFEMTSELFHRQNFTQIEISQIKKHNLPKQIDVAVLQRVLHYLPYNQAQKFLQTLTDQLSDNGKMYVSLTGIDSQIGCNYAAKDMELESRMGYIGEQDKIDFNLTEQVCLYSETDAKKLLNSIDGLSIADIWVSQFGNIKIIASKVILLKDE